MNKDTKISFLTLALQVTRRCNLRCDLCGKGEPQNIDITTEIIDKTFDEVQNYYISDLRLRRRAFPIRYPSHAMLPCRTIGV